MTKHDVDRVATERLAATAARRAQVKEQLKQGAMPFEIDSPERAEAWLEYHHAPTSMVQAVDAAFAARREGRRPETVLERVIGRDNLLSVSFLTRGSVVARAIAAIGEAQDFFGTGFMVTPRLLLTNHHVLPDAETAARCSVAFNFEDTLEGRIGPDHRYALDPSFFVTSPEGELDYTLVAVAPASANGGPPLAHFGHITLNPCTGKVLLGEPLNIIQHPHGGPKQVALRENRLTAVLDRYVHYEGDTNPGSSGSPVFNDRWDVVALHHSVACQRDGQGNWVANEGIRISRVIADVRAQVPAADSRNVLLDGFPSAPGVGQGHPERKAPSVRVDPEPDARDDGDRVSWTMPLRVTIALDERSVPVASHPRAPATLTESTDDAVDPASLAPADVLLYRGTGFVSRAIILIDGSPVSHAGLYLAGQGHQVGEAIGEGLVQRDLRASFGDDHAWVEARRLRTSPASMAPVLDVGRRYLAQREHYASQQLVLLAFLCLTRKLTVTPVLGRLVRAVLDRAATAVNDAFEGGRELMICSEYVYRAYAEATPAGPYDLRVQTLDAGGLEAARRPLGAGVHPECILGRLGPVDPRSAPPDGTDGGPGRTDELERLAERYLQEVHEPRTVESAPSLDLEALRPSAYRLAASLAAASGDRTRGGASGAESLPSAMRRLFTTAADFVTPGDLYRCPSLYAVGRVRRPAAPDLHEAVRETRHLAVATTRVRRTRVAP